MCLNIQKILVLSFFRINYDIAKSCAPMPDKSSIMVLALLGILHFNNSPISEIEFVLMILSFKALEISPNWVACDLLSVITRSASE